MTNSFLFKLQVGKIWFTGITPTNTALSLYTGDGSILKLTNKNYSSQASQNDASSRIIEQTTEFTLKPTIEAQCNFSVELKTAIQPNLQMSDYQSSENESSNSSRYSSQKSSQKSVNGSAAGHSSGNNSGKHNSKTEEKDWFQLAYFNTKFDLRNTVGTSDAGLDRESITITVEKPRFYLQPGSIDSAILFWLNYKSTYEYWIQQRQQFSSVLIDESEQSPMSSLGTPNAKNTSSKQPANEPIQAINNFIALKLR